MNARPGDTVTLFLDPAPTGIADDLRLCLADEPESAGASDFDDFAFATEAGEAGIQESGWKQGRYAIDLTLPVDLAPDTYSVVWIGPGITAVDDEPLVVETASAQVSSPTGDRFASADDLAVRYGFEFVEDEGERADVLLSLASGLIRDAARQTISLVENDTVTVRGTRERSLLLPQRPVVSVSSVLVNGGTLDASGYYLDGDSLVYNASLWSDLLGGGSGSAAGNLVVTYTHGYETVPETIRSICLEAVNRVWVNPGAVAQEGYGSERVVYPVQGLLLTPDERRAIRKVVGRRSESSTVR